MKNKDQTVLGRFSLLSIFLLIGGDLAVEPFSVMVGGAFLAAFSWIPFIGVFIGTIFGFFGTLAAYFAMVFLVGLLVFLSEVYAAGGKTGESLVEAMVVMFLVAIPTPLIGVATGVLLFLTREKMIKI